MARDYLPKTRNKSVICPLWEGDKFIVWSTARPGGHALMVQRLSDGEEWNMNESGNEADLLVDLLPECKWDAHAIDLACEDAWNLLGPKFPE